MIREGNITKFEHVCQYGPGEFIQDDKRPLIIVQLDGNPEMWLVKTTTDQAIAELREYYRSDWKDTNRVLPVRVFQQVRYESINCL